MARPLSIPLARPVHPWSAQRKSVGNLREDRQNKSAHLDPRPPGVAHQRCGPSRRDGRHVDGSLLAGQVKSAEIAGPRKTGASLTFLASCAQPQAPRRVLPRSASCRATWSARPSVVLPALLPAHCTAKNASQMTEQKSARGRDGGFVAHGAPKKTAASWIRRWHVVLVIS